MCLSIYKHRITWRTEYMYKICFIKMKLNGDAEKERFLTYFYKSPVTINKLLKAECLRIPVNKVEGEGIHGFVSEKEARKFIETEIVETEKNRVRIIKCRIPKGTEIWKGTFSYFSYRGNYNYGAIVIYKSVASREILPILAIKV